MQTRKSGTGFKQKVSRQDKTLEIHWETLNAELKEHRTSKDFQNVETRKHGS